MLNKLSGLARALYIVLAVIAGFVAMGGLNVALILVLLGLVAGLTLPRDRLVLAMVSVVALPLVGTALGTVPAVGAQLGAVMTNLQLGIAGAVTTAVAIFMYERVMEGVTGLAGGSAAGGSGSKATA